MARFSDIINPPTEHIINDDEQLYRHLDSVNEYLDGMLTISNPAQTINSDFSTLSAQGTTPTTEADGDNFEFVGSWFVVGATQATYVLTATPYPNNSPIISESPYFMDIVVNTYSGSGLYFYQRQMGVVRKFQTQYVTITVRAFNNLTTIPRLRFDVIFNLDPSTINYQGGAIYLQPGYNEISTTLKTDSLRNMVVGAGNYVELDLNFVEIPSGLADFELYSIKVEFGKISTPLN